MTVGFDSMICTGAVPILGVVYPTAPANQGCSNQYHINKPTASRSQDVHRHYACIRNFHYLSLFRICRAETRNSEIIYVIS